MSRSLSLLGRASILVGLALSNNSASAAQSVLYHLVGDSNDDGFGSAVSGLVDVDGDGLPDFVVGAPRDDNLAVNAGSVRVFSGRTGAVLYTLDGNHNAGLFGFAVAGVGDVNGDGRGDFLVGEPGDGASSGIAGNAHLYSGSDHSLIRSVSGLHVGDGFGIVLAALGDVDGDSIPDYAVASNPVPPAPAYIRVYSGASGSLIRTHTIPPASSSSYGVRLAAAGDTNGDGRQDYLISSPYAQNSNGEVWLFSGADGSILRRHFGSASETLGWAMTSLGDVDHDGVPDYALGAPMTPSGGSVFLHSGSTGALLAEIQCGFHSQTPRFGSAVSSAGDWNGDGVTDIAIGAPGADITSSRSGRVQVFSIPSGGLLATFDGQNDGWNLGEPLAFLGDVNGDGRTEFIAGIRDGPGHAKVYSHICDTPSVYCIGAPNSVGPGARIGTTGSTSFAANDLVLTASGLPPGKTGLFFFAFDEAQSTFGDGFRCVGSDALYRLHPAVHAGPAGDLQYPVSYGAFPLYFYPGANPRFQLWYRDPAGPGGHGTNTSDAVSVSICD